MKLVPSMDLRRGKVVRLKKGVDGSEETYDLDADTWVERLVAAGATLVHLVDLDGAFGEARQPSLLAYPRRYPHVRFQLGGGLRDERAVKDAISHGFSAVVGTLAVTSPAALRGIAPSDVVLALDVRAEEGGAFALVVRGWTETTKRPSAEVCAELRGMGLDAALVTDVDRDGLMTGPGLEAVTWVGSFGFKVQASGGIRSLDDVATVARVPAAYAAISGKAVLDGAIDLDDPRTRRALRGESW